MRPAVLFDMNGVLVDDEELHYRAFVAALDEVGLQLDHDDYLRHFAGRTDLDGLHRHLQVCLPKLLSDVEALAARKAAAYRELATSDLRPYDGATDVVRSLRESGHDLALVTSSTRQEAEVVLAVLGLVDLFRVVVTADDVSEGKPSPEPYLRAIDALGRPPSMCVVIEDSPSGVTSAKRAGAWCIAVTSTHTRDQLRGADLLVGTVTMVDIEGVRGLVT